MPATLNLAMLNVAQRLVLKERVGQVHRVVLLDDRPRSRPAAPAWRTRTPGPTRRRRTRGLFTSSAIHDRVGVEDVLVELERGVMSHVCAAVAIASQRRTSRRPLAIGPTARSWSAPGSFECPLSQRQSVHSSPVSKDLAWLSCHFQFSCIKKNIFSRRASRRRRATGRPRRATRSRCSARRCV